jgi:alpha-glucosidase
VPTLYMGEEIGMIDHPSLPPGRSFDRAGRDAQRTPMQWDASPGAGFSTGTPWLPLADPAEANVADQLRDPGSLLSLYRRLIAARRDGEALARGEHRSIFGLATDVLAWRRDTTDERLLILVNMGEQATEVDASRVGESGEVLIGTGDRRGRVGLADLRLDGLEGLVLRL